MAKMHKDYTIADMLRLGGAWVKTYADIEAIQKIAGTLVMMDKSVNDVTIEPFMRADKSIENDNEKIKAICLSIADGVVHEVKPPVKISAIARAMLKSKLTNYSSNISGARALVESRTNDLAIAVNTLKEKASIAMPELAFESINPTESSTFEHIADKDNLSIFVQTVPVNLSRVDADGNLTQRCLGRMIAGIRYNNNGRISISIGGAIDGITDSGCSYIHPNVSSSGDLCFGEGNDKAATFMAKGDVCGLLALADKVLRTSQYGNPYKHLNELLDSKREPCVLLDDDLHDLVSNLIKPSSAIIVDNKEIKMIPHEDIACMVSTDSDGLTVVKETDNPDVLKVSSSTLTYAPRALFREAIVYPIPTTGVHSYVNKSIVVDGNCFGSISKYTKPTEVEMMDLSSATGVYSGLLVKDGELYDIIANVVSGTIVAAVALSSGGNVLRLGPSNYENIKFTHASAVPSGAKKIVDTGVGLLFMSAGNQITHIMKDSRDDSPSVEGVEMMRDYWFSRVEA